jgi:uncharacterized protein YukE
MDPSDAEDLRARADTCDTQASRLDGIVSDLSSRSGTIIASWTGRPATSLRSRVDQQIAALRDVQGDLRAAAAALRRGAATPPHHHKK